MVQTAGKNVFVVDDEPLVLQAVGETLRDLGVEVTCFKDPAGCLRRLGSEKCDLIVTDLKMPGMDGLELLRNAKRMAPLVPVLILTGCTDVSTAVAGIKAGAEDLIEKPFVKMDLLRCVQSILDEHVSHNNRVGRPLTRMEARVLALVADGKSSREIAGLLSRSVRTIEVHLAHMMHKLGVKNPADLIKQAAAMGLADLPV